MSDDELLQKTEAVGDFFEISGMREHAAVIEHVSARIREQRNLLDECKQALESFEMHYPMGINPYLDEAACVTRAILTKLRAQEKANDSSPPSSR